MDEEDALTGDDAVEEIIPEEIEDTTPEETITDDTTPQDSTTEE
jgi:hypothetical protein